MNDDEMMKVIDIQEEEKEPCPTCGQLNHVSIYEDGFNHFWAYIYECPNCKTTYSYCGSATDNPHREKLVKKKFLFLEYEGWVRY